MLGAAFTKTAATNVPTADTSGEYHLHCLRAALQAIEAGVKSEFSAGAAQKAHRRLGQQLLARAVHQPQTLVTIKGENCYVDLAHHRAQKRRRLERAQALVA